MQTALTEREQFVLDELTSKKAKDLAAALQVTPSTITYIKNKAKKKLGIEIKKRPVERIPPLIPDPPKVKLQRAPAVYSNRNVYDQYGL